MDSAAKKTLEGIGRGLGVTAEELGRIRREERRQRRRFAVISLIVGVASFFLGAALNQTISPIRGYPFAAALPLLGVSSANRRTNILVVALISGVAFILGYLMMQWQPQDPRVSTSLYGVFGR